MKITRKEMAAVLEDVLYSLNYHRTITQNTVAVEQILKAADRYVEARSDEDKELAFKALKETL